MRYLSTTFRPLRSYSKQATAANMSKHNPVGFSGPLAETYNARTGGCNVRLANAMLSRTLPHFPAPSALQKAGGNPLRILDSASGPLVLTTQLLLDPSFLPNYSSPPSFSGVEIVAGDISADFVKANQASLGSAPLYTGLPSNVKVTADSLDGQDLSRFPANHFDASFTSLALFAYPDSAVGARELYRILKPGGVTSASSWKFLGWHDVFHAVERELGREGPETRFEMVEAWLPAGKLKALFEGAGFAGEDVTEEGVPCRGMVGECGGGGQVYCAGGSPICSLSPCVGFFFQSRVNCQHCVVEMRPTC